jgi:hypothetical protein
MFAFAHLPSQLLKQKDIKQIRNIKYILNMYSISNTGSKVFKGVI